MATTPLPSGKLPAPLLAELLGQNPLSDARVLVGPRPGEDAAVIDLGEQLLIATSDPITFATDAIGHYAVTVNANDIAVMGGTPRWFLATLLLPEQRSTESLVRTIFAQITRACQALHIALIGGHTEITAGLERPILCGHMLGEVSRQRLVTSAGARVGDAIVLTKGFPVEGIAILAREYADRLVSLGHPRDAVERWQRFLYDPGISVVRDAAILCEAAEVHAMHDPTEGGVATGLRELAQASGVGLHLFADQLPQLEAGQTLCHAFGLDALGTIASGALLAALPAAQIEQAIGACAAAGISCYHIGTVVADATDLSLHSAAGVTSLPVFSRDEMLRLT